MKEPTYKVKVEIEGQDVQVFTDVIFDGLHPDKPYFYVFRFVDKKQIEYAVGRVLYLEYGIDKADCQEYWRNQEKKAASKD